MKLDEKMQVVEILMLASCDPHDSVMTVATTSIGQRYRVAVKANNLRVEVWRTTDLSYEQSCVEAAYRLIETSPVLIREWFRAP